MSGSLAKGIEEVVQRVEAATEVWLPLIALGELRAGFAGGAKRSWNESKFDEFIQRRKGSVLLLDEQTSSLYGVVLAKLRRAGTPIPTNDIWIAAQALQHNLTLDTRDDHFKKVEGLKLV